MKHPDEPRIPAAECPDENRVSEKIPRNQQAGQEDPEPADAEARYMIPGNVVRAMADIATNVWKARTRMVDAASGEVREEMRRVYRHIENVFADFEAMDLEVKDHTGDAFDYGLPLKVVTTQPTRGITRESVIETIKPTIYWNRQIIQMGEVVIATPASAETKV